MNDIVVDVLLKSAEQTKAFGRSIGHLISDRALITLIGPLGAGKTCLVQGIGEALGVTEPVVSPTFTMLNEYHSGRLPLYHLDLYRLKDDLTTQAALGGKEFALLRTELDEFIYTSGVVSIEWVESIMPYLPQDYLLIEIDYLQDEEGRRLSIKAKGDISHRLIQDINSGVIYT